MKTLEKFETFNNALSEKEMLMLKGGAVYFSDGCLITQGETTVGGSRCMTVTMFDLVKMRTVYSSSEEIS